MTPRKTGTEPTSDLPKLAAPAQRALASADIHSLKQLSKLSEEQLKQLHGIGPNAFKTLRAALKEQGLSFTEEKRK